MKILFLIPDGIGIRNYLYSDLINHLKRKSDIHIWSPLPIEAFQDVEIMHQIKINYKYSKLLSEGFFTRIYKESATFARLIYNSKKVDNQTILCNWNYNPKKIKLKILNKITQFIGKWASKSYTRILYLEKKAINNWKKICIEKYKKELINLQPDKIFITHQRVAALMPVCIAAKQLGIEVVSVIYSWDNLPKARLAIKADKYLVWSEYMKDEMKLFYPEINQNNVIVTGTPQFEFYSQKERIISKQDFAIKFNLDTSKPWICFSGDDVKTSPYDYNYLNDVAEAVASIPIENRPQIIFRRCPVDFSDRYDKTLVKYSDFLFPIDPIWNIPTSNENWGFTSPTKEDVNLQVNIACHCDLVINLGSTMAFDFAMFDKPCFYINYDSVFDKNWSVKMIYQFQHFRTMEGLNAVGWINDKNEIKEKIVFALSNLEKTALNKYDWMEKVISNNYLKSSILIANELV